MAEQVQQTADARVQGLVYVYKQTDGLVHKHINLNYCRQWFLYKITTTFMTIRQWSTRFAIGPYNASIKWEYFGAHVLSVRLPCVPICPQPSETATSGWLKVSASVSLTFSIPVVHTWVQGAIKCLARVPIFGVMFTDDHIYTCAIVVHFSLLNLKLLLYYY